MFEITNTLSQGVHLAQALVHLFQAVCYLLEAFAQAGLQSCLQFFVNCLAHLVQLGGVALLKLGQLCFQGAAHFCQAACIGF